ncbi:MAG: ubiquinone biosynthesis protein COQ4 [Patiriisocius sp.]|jgi:ubiquinone biosynthesis protein COQ4
MNQANKVQPVVAIRAMAKLLKNPEATEEVFIIIRALSGDALGKGYRRFVTTPHARAILDSETSLLNVLSNREQLKAMPEGSLGRHYLAFMEAGNISAEGLKEASDNDDSERFSDPDMETYALRLRDQHDLWHVVTGFGRDVAGESCLLAFTYSQTKNRGVGFIGIIGALKLRRIFGRRFFSSMWQAFQMGRRTSWLPAQHWERMLTLPLQQVRNKLGLEAPSRYSSLPLELVIA